MVAKYEKHTLERMKEDLIVVPRNAGIRSSFFSLLPCLNRKTCYNIYCDSLEYAYIIMLVRIDWNEYDCYNRLQKDTAEKMMNRFLNFTKNFLITAAILVCGFLLSLFMQKEWGNQTLIPSIFLLDVFLVSVVTDGFLYGAVASVISILAVNYAFTFPYFKINFTIPEIWSLPLSW